MRKPKWLSACAAIVLSGVGHSNVFCATYHDVLTNPQLTLLPYAAIDYSGDIQQGHPVNLMALDNGNNLAFGFTNAAATQYGTYVVANGIRGGGASMGITRSDEGTTFTNTPMQILTDGSIYATCASAPNPVPQGGPNPPSYSTKNQDILLPPPYVGKQGTGSGDEFVYLSAVASDGSYSAHIQYSFDMTYLGSLFGSGNNEIPSWHATFIRYAGLKKVSSFDTQYNGLFGWLVTDPTWANGLYGYGDTNDANKVIPTSFSTNVGGVTTTTTIYTGETFFPTHINTNGWGVGFGYLPPWPAGAPAMTNTNQIWDGIKFNSLSNDVPVNLNDQNSVIVAGYDTNANPTEGYLWEENGSGNSTNTSFYGELTKILQGELSAVEPLAISNQKNPAGANADPTIKIITAGTNNKVGENDLFTRDNTGSNWSYGRIQFYPTTTLISKWVAVNASGVIAAIGQTNSTPNVSSQRALMLVPAELAVDANRDGTIVMASDTNNPANYDANGNVLPVDTTAVNPFVFWVNDGLDGNESVRNTTFGDVRAASDTVQDSLVVSDNSVNKSTALTSSGQAVSISNAGQNKITCTRDLQNFARLWMLTRGINASIQSGAIKVGLEWQANGGNATTGWATTDGYPAINLYLAAPKHGTSTNTGGSDYLTDTNTANDQAVGSYATSLGTAARGTPLYLPASVFANLSEANPKTYFLFEAQARGSGRLVITFNTGTGPNYTKIGEGGYISMQLKDVKELYERWTVGDGPLTTPTAGGGGPPTAQPEISQARVAAGISPLEYGPTAPGLCVTNDPTANDYILFIHGWNVDPWLKDAWAETVLKRLYWQGYKGKFGIFEWPTTYEQFTHYDDGEFSAWQSAVPLQKLLIQLSGQYNNGVFLLAHSMGNVVVGEAQRLVGQLGFSSLVNTYVATQAAVPGQCYDPTLVANTPLIFSVPNSGPTTANIYNNWLVPPSQSVATKASLYNVNDYALYWWNYDQILKPDIRNGYTYAYGGSPNDNPALDEFYKARPGTFGLVGNIPLHLGTAATVLDRYEIMAYDSEPRSLALGEIASTVAGFSSTSLQNIWPPDTLTQVSGPYSAHAWHSAEFYFGNAEMQNYWANVMKKFRIPSVTP